MPIPTMGAYFRIMASMFCNGKRAGRLALHRSFLLFPIGQQKKREGRKEITILRAALRYFSDSSRRLLDMWLMRSSESPRQSKSSMFLVMILVTSCKSSFNLSNPFAAGPDLFPSARPDASAPRGSR